MGKILHHGAKVPDKELKALCQQVLSTEGDPHLDEATVRASAQELISLANNEIDIWSTIDYALLPGMVGLFTLSIRRSVTSAPLSCDYNINAYAALRVALALQLKVLQAQDHPHKPAVTRALVTAGVPHCYSALLAGVSSQLNDFQHQPSSSSHPGAASNDAPHMTTRALAKIGWQLLDEVSTVLMLPPTTQLPLGPAAKQDMSLLVEHFSQLFTNLCLAGQVSRVAAELQRFIDAAASVAHHNNREVPGFSHPGVNLSYLLSWQQVGLYAAIRGSARVFGMPDSLVEASARMLEYRLRLPPYIRRTAFDLAGSVLDLWTDALTAEQRRLACAPQQVAGGAGILPGAGVAASPQPLPRGPQQPAAERRPGTRASATADSENSGDSEDVDVNSEESEDLDEPILLFARACWVRAALRLELAQARSMVQAAEARLAQQLAERGLQAPDPAAAGPSSVQVSLTTAEVSSSLVSVREAAVPETGKVTVDGSGADGTAAAAAAEGTELHRLPGAVAGKGAGAAASAALSEELRQLRAAVADVEERLALTAFPPLHTGGTFDICIRLIGAGSYSILHSVAKAAGSRMPAEVPELPLPVDEAAPLVLRSIICARAVLNGLLAPSAVSLLCSAAVADCTAPAPAFAPTTAPAAPPAVALAPGAHTAPAHASAALSAAARAAADTAALCSALSVWWSLAKDAAAVCDTSMIGMDDSAPEADLCVRFHNAVANLFPAQDEDTFYFTLPSEPSPDVAAALRSGFLEWYLNVLQLIARYGATGPGSQVTFGRQAIPAWAELLAFGDSAATEALVDRVAGLLEEHCTDPGVYVKWRTSQSLAARGPGFNIFAAARHLLELGASPEAGEWRAAFVADGASAGPEADGEASTAAPAGDFGVDTKHMSGLQKEPEQLSGSGAQQLLIMKGYIAARLRPVMSRALLAAMQQPLGWGAVQKTPLDKAVAEAFLLQLRSATVLVSLWCREDPNAEKSRQRLLLDTRLPALLGVALGWLGLEKTGLIPGSSELEALYWACCAVPRITEVGKVGEQLRRIVGALLWQLVGRMPEDLARMVKVADRACAAAAAAGKPAPWVPSLDALRRELGASADGSGGLGTQGRHLGFRSEQLLAEVLRVCGA